MEEIDVSPGCAGVGRTLEEVRGASMIVAMRRDGQLQPQPAPATTIASGDSLVALGTPDALERLESLFQPAGASKA
jgi:voltage-gated potassium channel